jgi:hypothetical protein
MLQRTLPAGFIAPRLPTKTDPPRLRQTGIHFILTSKMQTGEHGQHQRPGRLGHDGSHFAVAFYLPAVVATELFNHWREP